MSITAILCLVACLAVSFGVIFMLGGAVAPVWAATSVGQIVLAAVAAVIGWLSGRMAYQRFFPGR